VFAVKPIEYSVQAYLGVGTFITVCPTQLISNPLCYGEMVPTLLFHEKPLDASLRLFGIFGVINDMEHVLYTLPYPAHRASPQISKTSRRAIY
jgi:hypothetical protein